VIAKTHLRLGDVDAAVATLGLINDGSARLQVLRELTGPRSTGNPGVPEYVMPSPPGLPPRFDPAPPLDRPQGATEVVLHEHARTPFMVQVLDKLADDMRPRPEGTVNAPASEDTAGDQASVLAHIATMYVDAGNTERAKATLVEATRATTQWQQAIRARAPQQGTHGTTAPMVSAPLRDSMGVQDRSIQQQHPVPRPSMLGVLWPAVGAVVGFVGLGLVKPIIEAFGKGIVGRAIAEYFQNEGLASALGVKLTASTDMPSTKETNPADTPR
jgi:hypothetical protein